MAVREQKIEQKIQDLQKKITIYKGVQAFYSSNISFPAAANMSQMTPSKFIAFLKSKNFPNRIDAKRNNLDIAKDIDTYLANLYQKIDSLKAKITGSLDQLIILPSWTDFLDLNFKGFYINQPVNHIFLNPVIMLTDLALPVSDSVLGEPIMLITGVGMYFTKFEVQKGTIVTDYRIIDGFMVPLETWANAQAAESMTIKPSKSEFDDFGPFVYTEKLIDIPFSLLTSKRTLQAYARGVIARNVFIPLKEAIDCFYNHCKTTKNRTFDKLRILSGGLSSSASEPIFQNELLLEEPISNAYMQLIPGIKNIKVQLKRLEQDLELESHKTNLFENQKKLKRDFTEVGYPRLTQWFPRK